MSISRHTSYNLAGAIIPLGLALVTVPIYLRVIGPDRYGILALAWLLLGYFGLFDLGLSRAGSFRIAALRTASPQTRANTFWAALVVNVFMGLLGGVVLWIGSEFFFSHVFKVKEALRQEILVATPLLAASLPIAILTGVLTGVLQGREKFFEVNVISVTSTALFQLLPLGIAIFVGHSMVTLLGAALLARSLGAAFLFYRCYLEFGRGQLFRIDRKEIPILLSFGGWVTLTAILAPLLTMVDRFAIGATLGATYVAVYSVPYQLAQRIAIIPSALTNAMFPKLSAASLEGAGSLAARGTYALLAIMGPPVVIAIFLAKPFLNFWIGGTLASQAAPVAAIVLVAFWANAFALMPFVKLQATGRPDTVTIILLMEVPPYLACLYFGLKMWGLQGAALAFAARCVLDYLLLTWAAGKDYRATPLLLLNLGLLCAALICSRSFSIAEWKWWLAAASLLACSTGISVVSRYFPGIGRTEPI